MSLKKRFVLLKSFVVNSLHFLEFCVNALVLAFCLSPLLSTVTRIHLCLVHVSPVHSSLLLSVSHCVAGPVVSPSPVDGIEMLSVWDDYR